MENGRSKFIFRMRSVQKVLESAEIAPSNTGQSSVATPSLSK
ncbi:hypothetical protein M087_0945 [Bacteroides fragilis str. S23 R14]|nr:hypothetical protein M087_0945 [Bacteroides fragilis str. S23 R14]EYA67631.1 hypothetical protein M139_1032 [Bacteroides fragilis str. S23L24]